MNTWTSFFEQYLLASETTSYPPEEKRFCVSVLFLPPKWDADPIQIISRIRVQKAAILRQIAAPTTINGHDMGLSLFYASGSEALQTALDIERQASHHRRVSVSYGLGHSLQSHKSIHAFQAEKLNHLTNVHEITLTAPALAEIVLPDGVGAFQASKPMQSLAGFPFWIIKDYR